MPRTQFVEPLEARIAPALVLSNPLHDLIASSGQTGSTVELGQMLDATITRAGHTLVAFSLNLDLDPNQAGIQNDTDPIAPGVQPPMIVLELFDDEAPLTVQNFLRYVENPNTSADFLGTFFHRAVSGFVLQGGGYNASAPSTHITTFDPVHNEYGADRSNLRGTVAMAKTGLSPNTATSEWFINVNNNAGNLDNQNGGFTVFAQVVEGMQYVDQIIALPRLPSSEVPVQNYSTGTPTADNLISVTGVTVARPQAGDISGQQFEVVGVVDPATGEATNLVTYSFDSANPSKLKLNYNTKQAGLADVTVRVTKNGETIEDTFRVTVLPNLLTDIARDTLPGIVVPGDTVTPTIKITNNAGGAYQGAVTVKFYLSAPTNADPNAYNLDESDLFIGEFTTANLNIPGYGSTNVTGTLAVLPTLQVEGQYRLIAKVEPAADTTTQLYTDDDYTLNGGGHYFANVFGNIPSITVQGSTYPGRTGVKMTYTDPGDDSGTPITLSMTGSGNGRLAVFDDEVSLLIFGTNSASTVNVASSGRVDIENLDVLGPVGTLNLSSVDLTGRITLSTGIKVLNLGSFHGEDSTLLIGAQNGANNVKAVLNFGSVTDVNIESSQPIGSITATEWLDTGGDSNYLYAPSVGAIKITGAPAVAGDFEADVTSLANATMSTLQVKGTLRDSTIIAGGKIGTVTLGGMTGSSILAGSDRFGEYFQRSSIANVAIATGVFTDSTIAASTITKLVIPETIGQLALASTGAGRLELTSTGGDLDLTITDTTKTSAFTITTKALQTIDDLVIENTIGTFSFLKASVAGSIDFAGGARTIKLGNLDGDETTFHIGAFGTLPTVVNLTLGRVSELNLDSDQAIGNLTATEWLDADGAANSIVAPSIGTLVIKGATGVRGDLEADVTIERDALLSTFTVAGFLNEATVQTSGNVGTVTLGGMTAANFFVGTDGRPTALADFTTSRTINTFTIKGIVGAPTTATFLSDAQIAAAYLGKVTVRAVDQDNGGDAFGIVADRIASYTRVGTPVKTNLDTPATIDLLGDYSARIL